MNLRIQILGFMAYFVLEQLLKIFAILLSSEMMFSMFSTFVKVILKKFLFLSAKKSLTVFQNVLVLVKMLELRLL